MKDFFCILLGIYYFILLGRIILSWIPAPPEGLRPVVAFIYGVTEPVLRPLRPLIPPLRVGTIALDLSVIILFLGILFVQRALGCTGRLF